MNGTSSDSNSTTEKNATRPDPIDLHRMRREPVLRRAGPAPEPPTTQSVAISVKSSAIAVAARSQVTRGLLRPIACRAPINPIDPSVNHGPPSIEAPHNTLPKDNVVAKNEAVVFLEMLVILIRGFRAALRSG